MICPYCKCDNNRVVNSRSASDGKSVRRRRECLNCLGRFTTYESIETIPILVIKKDNSRQKFNRDKLISRLLIAFGKRSVDLDVLKNIVFEVENELISLFLEEVQSYKIAEITMRKLKKIDVVAYIRFASVYYEFSSVEEFMEELRKL